MCSPNSPAFPDGGFIARPAKADPVHQTTTPRSPEPSAIQIDIDTRGNRLPEVFAVFTAMAHGGLLDGLRVEGRLVFSAETGFAGPIALAGIDLGSPG